MIILLLDRYWPLVFSAAAIIPADSALKNDEVVGSILDSTKVALSGVRNDDSLVDGSDLEESNVSSNRRLKRQRNSYSTAGQYNYDYENGFLTYFDRDAYYDADFYFDYDTYLADRFTYYYWEIILQTYLFQLFIFYVI